MSPQSNTVTRCDIDGCREEVIVTIGILGSTNMWHACSSAHARVLLWHLKINYPGHRGIWTKGVNRT